MPYQYSLANNSMSYCTLDPLEAAKRTWLVVNNNMKAIHGKYSTVHITEDKKDIYIENIPLKSPVSLQNFWAAMIRKCEIGNRDPGHLSMKEVLDICTEYEDLQSSQTEFQIRFGGRSIGLMDICDISTMYKIPRDGLFMVVWKKEPKSIYIMNGGIYDDRWDENCISKLSTKRSNHKL